MRFAWNLVYLGLTVAVAEIDPKAAELIASRKLV